MRRKLTHMYDDIISQENLLAAWKEFLRGKRNKADVQVFQYHLSSNISALHYDLKSQIYEHGRYYAFNISDPKPRNIHKATVRDRLLHHAVYRILYPLFDRTFITDSFSCRKHKGTHKALNRFRSLGYKVSQNNTRICWVLKCDVKKFFANVDHETLLKILDKYIPDKKIIWLLNKVISSFETKPDVGLPLGNLTSQLFVNIYMNEFDQFVKHRLKVKYYIRYADDFVVLSEDKYWLENLMPKIQAFLERELKLILHENKIFIKTLVSGVDFLGWVHFPDHRVLRTTTKRRMIKRISECPTQETTNSYLGLLKYGNSYKIRDKLLGLIYYF